MVESVLQMPDIPITNNEFNIQYTKRLLHRFQILKLLFGKHF